MAAKSRSCRVIATSTARSATSQMPAGTMKPRPGSSVRSRSFSHVAGASSRRSPDSPFAVPRTSSIIPRVTMKGRRGSE